ncbi:CAAX prenyl protease-related protein [Rubritalea squalenifaciens DSM 18772]|uniref:CAAX prenyl protease-related protein n=1 Tax=Rubritalea squalenifaciens DSM 18772 TaxID=1123071 RepID=A0A1M6IDU8_9BACT|nr:CAAX prenyl protease-related protein [Rubritalea squalenifaciens]SHJ32624.1 CAAX prenyl protease-related protein [Rubritalea squalenifaciens DSM 18772]
MTSNPLTELRENKTYAHVVPFAAFFLLNMAMSLGDQIKWEHPDAPWWRHWPEQWMYPIQTILVLGTLVFYWKHYDLKWDSRVVFGGLMGVVGIGFWLLPTTLYDWMGYTEESVGWLEYLGVMPRREGFDPMVLKDEFGIGGVFVSGFLRFFRAVIIVSLVEEILWRGFLMRFILNPDGDYWKVPFGKPDWRSYLIVTAAFISIHQPVDFLGAFIYGSLTYWVAVKTKSLAACITMHAVANLLMGTYALYYGKFGLW